MDPSTSGTGGLVLARAQAASNPQRGGSTVPPDYDSGGFITQGGLGRVEPSYRYMILRWTLPTGGPADFPMALTYFSNAGISTEAGYNWFASYQRYVEVNGSPLTAYVNSGAERQVFLTLDSGTTWFPEMAGGYALTGSSADGYVETQADGTAFVFDGTGILRSVRTQAGVRWTMSWDGSFDFVRHIDGPFGRRTTLAYDGSNLSHIEDPDGRITTLSFSGSYLTAITTPELCRTSFVYSATGDASQPGLTRWAGGRPTSMTTRI